MEVPLAVLADYANTTDGGKLNIMGIFDSIRAPAFPARHPQLALVVRFRAGPAEKGTQKDLEIRFIDQDGRKLFDLRSQIEVPDGPDLYAAWDNIVLLANIQLPKPGRYSFEILVNGETKRSVPLDAELLVATP